MHTTDATTPTLTFFTCVASPLVVLLRFRLGGAFSLSCVAVSVSDVDAAVVVVAAVAAVVVVAVAVVVSVVSHATASNAAFNEHGATGDVHVDVVGEDVGVSISCTSSEEEADGAT